MLAEWTPDTCSFNLSHYNRAADRAQQYSTGGCCHWRMHTACFLVVPNQVKQQRILYSNTSAATVAAPTLLCRARAGCCGLGYQYLAVISPW